MSGVKREAEACLLTPQSTPAEVASWLHSVGMSSLVSKTSGLTGQQMLALSEEDMKTNLGMDKLIARRRLTLRLKEAGEVAAPRQAMADERQEEEEKEASNSSNRDALALDEESINRQLSAEADCIGCCRWSANKFRECLGESEWASRGVIDARKAELERLHKSLTMPQCSVVVVGSTGAGKSTLLNSLLGEKDVLPTNGMRACTAVLIELSYADDTPRGADYRGEVDFISQARYISPRVF
jgi:ABC-type multidrug transport system fused ATPase/permease subunit